MDGTTPTRGTLLMESSGLEVLHAALRRAGYRVIGPTVRDGAIVLGELESVGDLPFGWGVQLAPGGYRLRQRDDNAAFGHSAGPQSWKHFLHPPREKLWSADMRADGFEVKAGDEPVRRMAFFGARPCDLRAIDIQDEVLGRGDRAGSRYAARRGAVFIVAVNCTDPGETCFCVSMNAGPQAGRGYDLALTELVGEREHSFLIDVGSPAGADMLRDVPFVVADGATVARARAAVAEAAGKMGRSMQADGLPDLLAQSRGAARWDDVASRCLTCGNCTMACPTCFCTTVEDVTDLTGDHAERWQLWDSCFDLDFTLQHGHSIRSSPRSRYRHWLTHKLGSWHDQFGSSGCVGCGRCIVWCPVGIDITEEVAALQAEARQREAQQAEARQREAQQAEAGQAEAGTEQP